MNTKKMIAAVAVLALAFAAFSFVPAAQDDGDELDVIVVEGDVTSKIIATGEQKILIEKNVTIKEGGSITVDAKGELKIESGATVLIEKGFLTIFGSAVIDGDIVSKNANGLTIAPSTEDDVNINGSISVIGDTSTETKVFATLTGAPGEDNVAVYGDVTIGTKAQIVFTEVLFKAGSTLTVLGTASGDIRTAGLVTIDGISNAFNIKIAEASATIKIIDVAGTVTITDDQMYAYIDGAGIQYYVGYTGGDVLKAAAVKYDAENETFYKTGVLLTVKKNTVNLSNVKNVMITETVAAATAYDEETSQNRMYAETKMILAPLDAAKSIEAADEPIGDHDQIEVAKGGETVYFETMVIDGVDVIVNASATVSGEVTFLYTGKETFDVAKDEGVEFTVSGLVLIKKGKITNEDNVIAAKYTVKNEADEKDDTYYTTLKKAIENKATDITMLGKLIVKENITVPTDTKLKAAESIATGNTAVEIKKGATLEFADGAKFVCVGDIEVYGTLIFDNVNYGITYGIIYADVQLKNEAYIEYTNVYVALGKAKSGDEINAYNPKEGIIIDEDLILPAGVTFYNVNEDSKKEYNVIVNAGATFTIAGKLLIKNEASLKAAEDSAWNTKTPAVAADKTVKDFSVIVIGEKGMIVIEKLGTAGVYTDYEIAGAYFVKEKGKEYYITNIAYAFAGILDADDYTVTIANDNTIENLSVKGAQDKRAIVIFYASKDVATEITMKGFTFEYAQVKVNKDVVLNGDIGTTTGKVTFNDATAGDGTVFNQEYVNDAMNLTVTGAFTSENETVVSGLVFFKAFTYQGLVAVDKDLDDRRLTIASGATVFVIGNVSVSTVVDKDVAGTELYVAGTLFVSNSGVLTAEIVSVDGTLTVDKLDNKYGQITYQYLIVGGSTNSFDVLDITISTNGAALVSGEGMFNELDNSAAFVIAGSSVTADVLKDWMDDAASTEFYLDKALWMTAYVGSGAGVNIASYDADSEKSVDNIVPALPNMKFNGWQTYNEKTKTYTDIKATAQLKAITVGMDGYTKVYADVTKDIYRIYVLACEGIDDVYMDGKIMSYNGMYFYAEVAAGSHTLDYTKSNGYSGNAYISVIDGDKTTGTALSFTVNDDNYKDDAKYISLTGVQKSGTDVDPETHPEKSTGLTVTEILLIVVVIIMAIMAVVLILRLNRS